jgi:hypothetical protein
MKQTLYVLANLFAALVLILLLVDGSRPLAPIFVLLALAVICALLPSVLSR